MKQSSLLAPETYNIVSEIEKHVSDQDKMQLFMKMDIMTQSR